MNTRQQHGEHAGSEQGEGLGRRVRRFIDTELSRALDKEDRVADQTRTDHQRAPDAAPEFERTSAPDHAPEHDRVAEFGRSDKTDRAAETERSHETERSPEFDRDREPVNPYADAPARTGLPVSTAAPVDTGPVVPAHQPAVEDPTQSRGRSSDEAAADGSAERVGLLNDPAGLRDEWQQVQGTFVDDPKRAVHEASVLVDRTLQEIHKNVTQVQISDSTSTEDLRVSFQRYREFFQRLLSA